MFTRRSQVFKARIYIKELKVSWNKKVIESKVWLLHKILDLRSLEKSLSPSAEDDKLKGSILKTVKNINEYLNERELFWMYFE